MVPGHDATEEPRDDARGPSHEPVMLARIVELLAPSLREPGSVLVDGTLGLGGHSEAVLAACPGARVVGIDRDTEALARAGARLAPYGERFTGVHATYDELPGVLAGLGLDPVGGVMGVLLDLGVSSMQLDVLDRGFAYRADAPLDMRMDGRGEGPTAADVLNTYSAADLALVLSTYGEERFARRIADAVVVARASAPFSTSARLVELLYDVIPAPARRTGGHPAKRTFQALRMEVNDELGGLERVLPAALDAVAVGGRVVVEAYHSLEDRLVKRAFAEVTRSVAPPDLPVVPPELQPAVVGVTRGAEQADDAEREHNPRAASVRLRAVERVRPASATARPPRATRSTRSARQRPARSRPASGGHR